MINPLTLTLIVNRVAHFPADVLQALYEADWAVMIDLHNRTRYFKRLAMEIESEIEFHDRFERSI